MVASDIGSIVDATRQMGLAISQFDTVRAFDPACSERLQAVTAMTKHYVVLRVVDENGAVICASDTISPREAKGREFEQAMSALATNSFQSGVFMPGLQEDRANLMFNFPFTGLNQRRGVVDLGISVPWLKRHFATFDRMADSRITISDRTGCVVVQVPELPGAVGNPLPKALLDKLGATESGLVQLADASGSMTLAGYAPSVELPMGPFTDVRLDMRAQTTSMQETSERAYVLMALGLILSAGLAMFIGQRFVRRPTNELLRAARAFSSGDLRVRVPVVSGDNSEFGRIAAGFNVMAEELGRQHKDGQELRATLEARVAERTADLQFSRDRLQVALGEQAKSEASLAQAQKLQAVGQLAGGIAHDFNNLLTAVIGALELLRIRIPSDDARSQRLINNALHAADRGGRLTQQLLTFSRRQRLLPVATDLNTVVLGMLSLLTTTLGRDIRVETGLARVLWPALVDPHQVESAILNLALNARDAMPNGGTLRISTSNVTLSPPSGVAVPTDGTALPAAPPAGEYVMIRVTDTGHGMPPEILARVFEPFFTTKETGRGSGLGLSQVHGLAAQSGGELRAESQPGLGTSISLLLPRAKTAADRIAPVNGTIPGGQSKLRVLVVDDDTDVRKLTGEMLSELGHHPILVADGAAALTTLGEVEQGNEMIDLMLADYAMPGRNGMEVIAEAANMCPGLASILVTGHADIDGPMLVGGQKVLRKPFTMAALAMALEDLAAVRV